MLWQMAQLQQDWKDITDKERAISLAQLRSATLGVALPAIDTSEPQGVSRATLELHIAAQRRNAGMHYVSML